MLEIKHLGNNEILLSGRFDASQVETANAVFNGINESYIVNFKDLEYISSLGLGVLLKTQKRISEQGNKLTLTNINAYISQVFKYAGFNMIFEIE